MNKKQKKILTRIILAAVLLVALSFLPLGGWMRFAAFLLPYGIIGYDILIKAAKGIINRQPFDENFLMAVATVGAIALGEYVEGVAVMLFYQTGELFQSVAVGKSRKSIAALMDIRPDYANIEKDGVILRVDPDEVQVGSVIVVHPGEKIPIDGCVLEGESALDTAALTGESLPRDVGPGCEVISGCINITGVMKIRTTREFGESTVSKILDLVENASSRKSKSENFISKFARYYTPVVCIAALLLALLPPLFRIVALGVPAVFSVWIYRALTFLVISCPCALVISIPLSFFAGIGGASSAGVLIKGSNYIEALSKVKCIAFDKTGTLTKGQFEVAGIYPEEIDEKKLLEYAALAESFSSHPIARSIVSAYSGELDRARVSDVREISGEGVCAVIDGESVAFGNEKLLSRFGAEIRKLRVSSYGEVHAIIGGRYCGKIEVRDALKPQSESAIRELSRMGIKRLIMLTGDSGAVAEKVAEELGINEVYSSLLPADKVNVVERLIAEKKGSGLCAFVGDGINDAPVLSLSDVGIAMGALGSDAAIEAADVVLMDDNPQKVAKAIRIAKKCMRIVCQNIYFSIGIKLLCLILGASGFADMWFAIFADVGVMVLAVLNAIRALYVRNI